jgi:YHS domain-containing protein
MPHVGQCSEPSSDEAAVQDELRELKAAASRIQKRIVLLESKLNSSATSQPSDTTVCDEVTKLCAPELPAGSPPLGLDGFCPVTLTDKRIWSRGNVAWVAVHRGRTYLFVGESEQQRFLKAPDRYAPIFSGNDVVSWIDQITLEPGKREHGVFYNSMVLLFANEQSLATFCKDPTGYLLSLEERIELVAMDEAQAIATTGDQTPCEKAAQTVVHGANSRALSARSQYKQVPKRNECAKQRLEFASRRDAALLLR